jgi:hypothetical protein
MIGLGVIFLFKRLADMDRNFEFRLFLVTLVISLTVSLLFIGYGFSLADSHYKPDCPENYYCGTEF